MFAVVFQFINSSMMAETTDMNEQDNIHGQLKSIYFFAYILYVLMYIQYKYICYLLNDF